MFATGGCSCIHATWHAPECRSRTRKLTAAAVASRKLQLDLELLIEATSQTDMLQGHCFFSFAGHPAAWPGPYRATELSNAADTFAQDMRSRFSEAEALDVWEYRDELARSDSNLAEIRSDLQDTDSVIAARLFI